MRGWKRITRTHLTPLAKNNLAAPDIRLGDHGSLSGLNCTKFVGFEGYFIPCPTKTTLQVKLRTYAVSLLYHLKAVSLIVSLEGLEM